MQIGKYLQSRIWQYFIKGLVGLLLFFFLWVFRLPTTMLFMLVLLILGSFLLIESWEYHQRNSYYRELFQQLEQLQEQTLLVRSILPKPTFYEGQLVDEELAQVYQGFLTQLRSSQKQAEYFKDFINLWIHEVKIPLATYIISIICHLRLNNLYNNYKIIWSKFCILREQKMHKKII